MPCIFCGGTSKLSREHVFPQWMREAFPDEPAVDYTRRLATATTDDSHQRPGVPFDVVVRDVCSSCNNGWLSELESTAAPVLMQMLRDQETRLDAVGQAVAATWATKTMLTLQGTNLGGDRIVSGTAYSWFAANQAPLPGSHVWLCRYGGAGQWPLSCHQHGIVLTPPESGPPAKTAQVNAFDVVIAIGPLVFWLFGHELPAGPITRAASDEAHLLIWPATGPDVSWPPPKTLDSDGDLEVLSRRLPGGIAAPLDGLS